jgi:23S rRNA (adenine2503-C2)-methyltransferase
MLSLVKRLHSNDGTTTKYVWKLEDYNTIESVYIRFASYDSLGISSQAGCNLKCAFCATGLGGLVRNLTVDEIVAQVDQAFEEIGTPKRDFKVAFMGMGEPLLNFNAVINAQRYLRSKYPEMRFSLSTVGIVPKIYALAESTTDVQLQISLHAPNNPLRTRLMPVTKKYPLEDVLEAARHYVGVSGKMLRINYLLLDGVNDSDAHADELIELLRDLPAYLKLSKFNVIPEIDLSAASNQRHRAFEARCAQAGLRVYQFRSLGVDIDAGMGMLRSHVYQASHQDPTPSDANVFALSLVR